MQNFGWRTVKKQEQEIKGDTCALNQSASRNFKLGLYK